VSTDEAFDQLVAAAEAYRMEGWDWSALVGRYGETPPPWDYRTEVVAALQPLLCRRPPVGYVTTSVTSKRRRGKTPRGAARWSGMGIE
jgi:hypothetical protein